MVDRFRNYLSNISQRLGEMSPSARLLIGSIAIILAMGLFLVAQYAAGPSMTTIAIDSEFEGVAIQRIRDAGYDAEWVHEFCRDDWQVERIIKPAVHRSDGQHNGTYRSEMTEETLTEKDYGRRWLVESFMSGLKRTTGAALAARTQASLFIEASLRVLAYAIRR